MGHTYFFEDGIEQNNTVQYNLAVYTRPSNYHLNTDQTPASFWITNPQVRRGFVVTVTERA
jgi:hypothetical protein